MAGIWNELTSGLKEELQKGMIIILILAIALIMYLYFLIVS